MRRFFALYFLLLCLPAYSQIADRVIYKQLDSTTLYLDIYRPDSLTSNRTYPGMIFFFGGGWNSGTTEQFVPHAKYFASRGIICFLADYRVNKRHQTTPIESLKDAKSAIRFLRKNADQYRLDTSKIIAAGGSAGGHLAAATALVTSYNEETDDLSFSSVPNVLVLFNPVIDNGPGGYGYERIGAHYKDFSPLHNIKKGAPPTIFFLGTEDKHIPVQTAEYYKTIMEKVGSRCELHLFEGASHGFFNYRNQEYYRKTVSATDNFLASEGFVKENPTIKMH